MFHELISLVVCPYVQVTLRRNSHRKAARETSNICPHLSRLTSHQNVPAHIGSEMAELAAS